MSDDPAAPLPPRVIRYLVVSFYLLLAGAGLLMIRVRTGAWLPDTLTGGEAGASLLYGLAFAALVIAACGPLIRHVPWMRWLAIEMQRLLGRLDGRTLLLVALASGLGEEIFFRGALQPALGLIPTSVIFGLVHIGPDRRYLVWTAFAMAVGLALGWMVEATGSLVGPIVAHVLVNLVNLGRIGRMEGAGRSDPGPGVPPDLPIETES